MSSSMNETIASEVDKVMQASLRAFYSFRKSSLFQRAALLRSIATALKQEGDSLIQIASQETHLTSSRLKSELVRACYQLTSYAQACEEASWMDIRIDTEMNESNTPRPDIRKMMVPVGPVVVFGASNLPFAYSTAGGDTASALVAGCSVVVKAHPAHPLTSEMTAVCIQRALNQEGLPPDIFQHVVGSSVELAKSLVQHPASKAVGFTGSFSGGKQMFDWAMQRPDPIPVFAEMGSLNPVFLLPNELKQNGKVIAEKIADSVLQSSGQFCTKPGLLIGIDGPDLDLFSNELVIRINNQSPTELLHEGILQRYVHTADQVLSSANASVLSAFTDPESTGKAVPMLVEVMAKDWMDDERLRSEVFGPFTMIIRCKHEMELLDMAASLDGQLTASVHASSEDKQLLDPLYWLLLEKAGRLIMNGVPTGVTVAWAMHHGGPFPATSDSRFTAVGPDAIKRFARPVSFQNWKNEWLPDELKNENPLKILRWVNGELNRHSI